MNESIDIISSFSGGLTSARMAKYLIDEGYNVKFIFANTGFEHPNTLDFINKCHIAWDLDLTWIEAVVHKGVKGCTHKVVTYETAKRNCEPFEEVIKKYGIPNKAYPHCNRELKINPIKSWIKENNYQKLDYAIGIRADEFDRMSVKAKERNIIYPLISMIHTTKQDVIEWWSKQPFDLDLSEHLGNCETCWKKSPRKQMTIAKNSPEKYDFFKRMELEHKNTGYGDSRQFNSGVRFNRETISIEQLIEKANIENFKEFKEDNSGYQLDFFKMDVGDGGCSESCEAFL